MVEIVASLPSYFNGGYLSNPLNVVLSLVLVYVASAVLVSLKSNLFRFDELKHDNDSARSLVPQVPDSPIAYNWKPRQFPPTIVWRTYTPLELCQFDGTNGNPILFAVNRMVYDVSAGRNFYGPNGPYGNFAGRDASRGLAKQSFDEDVLKLPGDKIDQLDDLTPTECENLKEWEQLFQSKYIVCGELIENSDRANQPL